MPRVKEQVSVQFADQNVFNILNTLNGFNNRRSIATDLIELASYAIHSIKSVKKLDVVYTDLRKAFDRVRHNFLIQTLFELGVHGFLYD